MTLRFIIIAVIAWWALIIGGVVYAGGACSAEPEAWVGPRHYDDPRVLDMVRPVRAVRREPQVRAYVRREEPRRRDEDEKHADAICKPNVIAAGDEAKSEEAAKLQGVQHWLKTVRFEYGEKFLEFDNARHAHIQCSRSDFPMTGGKVGAALDAVVHNWRCKVIAQPCMAPIVRVEK